jgi:hypothetical protein
MQKTLIDPFELASRMLPSSSSAAAPRPKVAQVRKEEPVEKRPIWVPRGEAWARARCWCSEE